MCQSSAEPRSVWVVVSSSTLWRNGSIAPNSAAVVVKVSALWLWSVKTRAARARGRDPTRARHTGQGTVSGSAAERWTAGWGFFEGVGGGGAL